MRPSLLFVALLGLTACSKTAEPARLSDFLGEPGQMNPACVDANDGKRFVVEGHVAPAGDVAVSDGKVSLGLYDGFADGEGQGRSPAIELKEGSQVDFQATDVSSTFTGGRSGSKGTLAGVTLHTDKGDATPADRLGVVFEVELARNFQSNAITGCSLNVVELRKL